LFLPATLAHGHERSSMTTNLSYSASWFKLQELTTYPPAWGDFYHGLLGAWRPSL
jgi:hypothetical protein